MDYSQRTARFSNKVSRLSLQFGSATRATSPASTTTGLSQVRSLAFFGLKSCLPSISEFKVLRFLILHIWSDEPSTGVDLRSISELLLLRSLQVTCNDTVLLPDLMQGPKHLETVEVNARLASVPSNIVHLRSWLHLRLGVGTELPDLTGILRHVPLNPPISLDELSSPPNSVTEIQFLPPICRIPKWIGQLVNLCILKFVVTDLQRDDINNLQKLPFLTFLSLHVQQRSTGLIGFAAGAFTALECFEFRCSVLRLMFQKGTMPNLQRLRLGFNAHRGEQYDRSLLGIEDLSSVQEISALIGVANINDFEAAETAFMEVFRKHPSNVSVKRGDMVEEDGPAEKEHPIREKYASSKQVAIPKQESEEDIKQNAGSNSQFIQRRSDSKEYANVVQDFPEKREPARGSHEKVATEERLSSLGRGSNIMDLRLSMIETITNNFSEDQKVGGGGYGDVYKAVYHGEDIAVKKLHPLQGLDDKQFHSELLNLTKVSHKNVVRLIGYCYESRSKYLKHNGETIWATSMERVLCFEFMEGGSLENHISDESCELDWPTCYNIIRGTCEGLNHLHSAPGNPIFHLDLKPANILLDKSMTPKIADLGLSRIFASSKTHETEIFKGTQGYMPPEYINNRLISKKFDVFSFGVIIIKMVAGNAGYICCSEMSPEEFIKLVSKNWMKRLQAMPGLSSSHEIDILRVNACAEIALRCVDEARGKRPCVEDIVCELEKLEAKIKVMSQYSDM